jgi:dTDP-4-dehydrorhamnose reductase
MKKLLITGSAGMLGGKLFSVAKADYEVYGLDISSDESGAPERIVIDLTDQGQVDRAIDEIKPDLVVHCAALTDVNYCEKFPELARSANALATKYLALACNDKAKLIYISTAAVFDGKKGDYREDDATAPVNVYARTKLAGEDSVGRYVKDHIIIRTDIVGWKKKQYFVQGIYDTLSNGQPVTGYSDAYFSPISASSISNCILKLLETDYRGKLHIGSAQPISKYDFSLGFARAFGFNEKLVFKGQADGGRGAGRPANTGLNVERAIDILKHLNMAIGEISVLAKEKRH